VTYSWKSTFIASVQNVLEIQCNPQHVSSRMTASIQRCWGSCRQSDRHPQCDGEVLLRCKLGFLGGPTGKTLEDSNLVSVEVMQWASSIYPLVMIGVIKNILNSWLKCAGAPSCVYHIHDLTATGTSSSSFCRSRKRKSWQWLPVSWCGKTCGPTNYQKSLSTH
jgi:hypothetical protein